jgi:Fe-S cluster assembly protein SufD
VSAAEASFLEELEERQRARSREPDFLSGFRAWGQATFERLRLPTLRLEDWRYTSLAALAERAYAPAGSPSEAIPELPPAPRLVFANGRIDAGRTDLAGLPEKVRLSPLSVALRERPALLERHLLAKESRLDHPFVALNAGLFEDGALVELGEGVTCERPLHLVFHSSSTTPMATHPRNLVLASRGARATVVEHYRGAGPYLVNAVTEVVLEEAASLEHDRLQEDGPQAFHLGVLAVKQGPKSSLRSESFALGAKLARVELRARLAGEGAVCDLSGLYVASGSQLLDHQVEVDHVSPRCTSREVFKGILDGSSRGVFAGRIKVREGAIRTDADQVNSNLLLSEEATIDTKPQLEILTDDVKCSHGGTVGQLREDQLFYLRTRGIPAALARAMLTWAFASEMVERLGPDDLKARIGRTVRSMLRDGALLREVA